MTGSYTGCRQERRVAQALLPIYPGTFAEHYTIKALNVGGCSVGAPCSGLRAWGFSRTPALAALLRASLLIEILT